MSEDNREYEMSGVELVNKFAESYVESLGLIAKESRIIPESDYEEYLYYRGILLARLDGQKPPFKPGDLVWDVFGRDASPTACKKVDKDIYKGDSEWILTFWGDTCRGDNRFYSANRFSLNSSDVFNGLDLIL